MFKTAAFIAIVSVTAAGCFVEESSRPDSDDRVDVDHPVETVGAVRPPAPSHPGSAGRKLAEPSARPLQLDGTYRVVGHWDLTGAFIGESLGDTLARLLIAEAAGSLGIPSWWEDDAEDALLALAREPLANFIDANTPDVVGGSDGLMAQLSEIFSNVEVVSRLSLTTAADGTSVSGSEEITSLRLHYDGQSVDVPVAQLASVAGAGTIVSDIVATRDGDTVAVDDHSIVLRTDPLAAFGLNGLLSISDLTTYAEQAIDCDAVVAGLTGGNGLSISFAGQTVSVGEGTLVSACEAVRGEALEQVIGFFQTEIGVSTGGPMTLQDDNGDADVDRLFSADGYAGVITSLPSSLQAPFAIELVGTRK